MSDWAIVPNPTYAGKAPRPLRAVCHDRTAFLSVRCPRCAAELHVHESQTARVPADAEIATRCPSCRGVSVMPPGFFAAAFAQLREQGWLE